MNENLYGPLIKVAIESLPGSLVGWLGVWLLLRSVEIAKLCRGLGGPYAFLAVWGFAVFASIASSGRAAPAIDAFYYSLLALGVLATLINRIIAMTKWPRHR